MNNEAYAFHYHKAVYVPIVRTVLRRIDNLGCMLTVSTAGISSCSPPGIWKPRESLFCFNPLMCFLWCPSAEERRSHHQYPTQCCDRSGFCRKLLVEMMLFPLSALDVSGRHFKATVLQNRFFSSLCSKEIYTVRNMLYLRLIYCQWHHWTRKHLRIMCQCILYWLQWLYYSLFYSFSLDSKARRHFCCCFTCVEMVCVSVCANMTAGNLCNRWTYYQ